MLSHYYVRQCSHIWIFTQRGPCFQVTHSTLKLALTLDKAVQCTALLGLISYQVQNIDSRDMLNIVVNNNKSTSTRYKKLWSLHNSLSSLSPLLWLFLFLSLFMPSLCWEYSSIILFLLSWSSPTSSAPSSSSSCSSCSYFTCSYFPSWYNSSLWLLFSSATSSSDDEVSCSSSSWKLV